MPLSSCNRVVVVSFGLCNEKPALTREENGRSRSFLSQVLWDAYGHGISSGYYLLIPFLARLRLEVNLLAPYRCLNLLYKAGYNALRQDTGGEDEGFIAQAWEGNAFPLLHRAIPVLGYVLS